MYVVVGRKKITTTTTTTSVGYGLMRLSPRLLSESILRNPLPEASRIPLLSSGWRERSCNVAARIMRWGGSPARALTSSDSGIKTMHDNVQLMLVKLRLKADMPYVALDMLKEV